VLRWVSTPLLIVDPQRGDLVEPSAQSPRPALAP